jgi:uncharacterized cupin superfamily protein
MNQQGTAIMNTEAINRLYSVINTDAPLDYAPFDYPAADGDGTSRFGEIHLMRSESASGKFHAVGFWRVEPGVSPLYDMPLGDETGLVLEGSATIEFLDQNYEVVQTQSLREGDAYTYEQGTLQRWTVHAPFRKFVIVVGDQPAG